MNPSLTINHTPSRSRLLTRAWLAVIAALAAFPIIAQAVSDEFNWGLEDGLVWGGMLAVLAVGGALVLRRIKVRGRLLIALGVLISLFLLVWAELAVGLFD